jgi:hypothetical protein
LIEGGVDEEELRGTAGDELQGETCAVQVGGQQGDGAGTEAVRAGDGGAVGVEDGGFAAGVICGDD